MESHVIKMAREAKLIGTQTTETNWPLETDLEPYLDRFYQIARDHVLEIAAQVCENRNKGTEYDTGKSCAEALREMKDALNAEELASALKEQS